MPNTSVLLPNSTPSSVLASDALTGNVSVLLQGLMESWGWHDPHAVIYAEEERQGALDQHLKHAMADYIEKQDAYTKAQFIDALEEALKTTETEAAYALRQQAYYKAQVKREAKEALTLSYWSQWQAWTLEGMKTFFGSTTEELVKKYAGIAQMRQAQHHQLKHCLLSLKSQEQAGNTPLKQAEDQDKKNSIIGANFVHFNQRRLLSASLTSASPIFPGIFKLSGLNGLNGFKLDGSGSGGVSTVGDINGDGIDDIIVCAPGASSGQVRGRSYVIFGSPNRVISGVLNLSSLNGINGFKLDGETGVVYSIFSASAAGDINGDGFDDLIIGAPSTSLDSKGRSYVVFGRRGIGAGGVLALSSLNGTNGFKLDGESFGDYSGWSVSAAGDVNGDGYADLLIGGYQYSSSKIYVGRSYVVFGSSSVGKQGVLALANLNGVTGFKLDGEASSDYSGFSVSSAGDVNGDGFDDLLIGAFNHAASTGRTYVIFGKSGIGSSGVLPLSSLNGANGFKIDGEAAPDISGYSVSGVGDINGDNISDLVIAAPYRANSTGRSYVVFGRRDIGGSGVLALSSLNGTNGFKLDGENFQDYSGWFISAAGDFNGDGCADFLIAAGNHGAQPRSYLVFGGSQLGLSNNGVVPLSSLNGVTGFKLDGEVPTYGGTSGAASVRVSSAGDVNDDGYDDLLIGVPGFGRSYVVFGDNAQIWINQLVIHAGETAVLTASNLNATRTAVLIFNISNIQHGHFEQLSQPGQTIISFNQSQVTALQIQFVHDGSHLAPSYTAQATSRIARSPLQAANITFYRRPALTTNQLVIHQGQQLLMASSSLAIADEDYFPNQVIFTVSNLQYGQFQLLPLNFSVTQFSQQQLLNQQVFFMQDNSTNAPSYSVSLSDPYFKFPPSAAKVSFYRRLHWLSNQLSLSQGERAVLTSADLSVEDDYSASQVVFTPTEMQHVAFQWGASNTSVFNFTEQQVVQGEIVVVHDSSPIAPSYRVGVQDGYFTLAPQAAVITFTPLPPVLVNNRLSTFQGRSTALTLQDLSGTDPDLSFQPGDLSFTVSGVQYGVFRFSGSSQPVFQFTQAQINGSHIVFIQDGSASAPSYQVVLSDGRLSTPPQPAAVIFYAAPTFINNRLKISRGETVVLDITSIRAVDDHTPEKELILTASQLKHGHFASVLSPKVSVTNFTQKQISGAEIQFTADGTFQAPAYLLTVTDNVGLSKTQAAQVTFKPFTSSDESSDESMVPNAIIGSVVSGSVGLLFLVLKLCIARQAKKRFERAASDAEGSVDSQQSELYKNLLRPLAQRILQRVKVTGFLGYANNRTMQEAMSAMSAIVYALEQQGVDINIQEMTPVEQNHFLETVARQTQRILLPHTAWCSLSLCKRFFYAEVTPHEMEEKASEIALAVKAAFEGSTSSMSDAVSSRSFLKSIPLGRSKPSEQSGLQSLLTAEVDTGLLSATH